MKTLILIAAFIILALCGGKLCLSLHTQRIARTRMLLHLLGDRFQVQAKITPLWTVSEQVGQYRYCGRIYSVSLVMK